MSELVSVDEESDKPLTDQAGLTATLLEEGKAEESEEDDVMNILKNIKIEGMPPPMVGV